MRTRLRKFIQAQVFNGKISVDDVARVIDLSLISVGSRAIDFELDDRASVKLAAAGVAFCREVESIVGGNLELDVREEAILDAVVHHFGERGESEDPDQR